jgi:hypothetical protein
VRSAEDVLVDPVSACAGGTASIFEMMRDGGQGRMTGSTEGARVILDLAMVRETVVV